MLLTSEYAESGKIFRKQQDDEKLVPLLENGKLKTKLSFISVGS